MASHQMQNFKSIVAIVFSKDRAMQLDAALRSLQENCLDIDHLDRIVIYTCSHGRHDRQYEALKERYPGVRFVREQDFQSDLVNVLRDLRYVLFLVDDNLFVRQWSISQVVELLSEHTDAVGFSLRLGTNTTYCYCLNAVQQPPEFEAVSEEVLKFKWPESDKDFGYPADVSSSVYRVSDLLPLIEGAQGMKNPNLLEKTLDESKSSFIDRLPYLLCFEQSVAFCNPVNVVQSQYVNRHGDDASLTSLELMRRYELGYRIDLQPFRGLITEGCHQLVPIRFLAPNRTCGPLSASVSIACPEAGHEDAPAVESAGEKGVSCHASCRIDLDALAEPDRDSVHRIARLIRDVSENDTSSQWLYSLAGAIEEDRKLDISEFGRTVQELRQAKNDLLELKSWATELDRARERLEKELNETYEQLISTHAELASALNEKALTLSELASTKDELASTSHELASTKDELASAKDELASACYERDMARNELNLIHASRAFKLATIFRDARNSKVLAVLLPVRLLLLILPSWLAQRLRNIALPLFKKDIDQEPEPGVIYNSRWPKDIPPVSVVIPCLNCGRNVEEAIDSVLAQTWQDLEIIVVDGGSDDPNGPSLLDNLQKPRTLILGKGSGNLSRARNAGIGKAKARYICCLDEKDKLAPTYLEKCIFRLENEGLDICGSCTLDFGNSRQVHDPGPYSLERLLRENCLVGASVFRRSLWESVGGYDEAMVEGHEDWEFWIRTAKAGARVMTLQEPLLMQGKSEKSSSVEALEKRESASDYIQRKHRDLPSDKEAVARIDKQRSMVKVEDGLCNLASSIRAPAGEAERAVNVLLVSPFLTVGGAETIISQVCRYLSDRNIHFTVITTCSPHPANADSTVLFQPATREIYHLPRFLPESQWQPFIHYLLKSRSIDIVWQTGSSYFYTLMPWVKLHCPEVKIVDLLFNSEGHVHENRMYKYCVDLNVVESITMKSWLIENHEEEEDRIRVIPNGVDLEKFKPGPKRRPPFDSRGASFVVGYLGRFSYEKGPDIFVEIARLLKDDSRVLFVMAGGGGLEKDVLAKIQEYGLDQSVKMVGFVDTPEFLPCCDVVLMPSRIDGRPNVLLEALAMGIPVIATAIGGIPEVLRGYEVGLLCASPDPDEFRDKLLTLLSTPELLRTMKVNARRRAESGLGIEQTLKDYERLFNDLAGRTRA